MVTLRRRFGLAERKPCSRDKAVMRILDEWSGGPFDCAKHAGTAGRQEAGKGRSRSAIGYQD